MSRVTAVHVEDSLMHSKNVHATSVSCIMRNICSSSSVI